MSKKPELRHVNVNRYIMPLREGGSLPALAGADDGFKYVLKFKGAGHGTKALIAELLGGLIAKEFGLKVPEIVFARLDEAFGRTEGDEEIQDLLKASRGTNLGLHFLSSALTFDPSVNTVDEMTASQIVWLDGLITNMDRTFKNTNLLIWNRELWLIDHGASFYFHHAFKNWEKSAKTAFPLIKDHVLLSEATKLKEVDNELKIKLPKAKIEEIVGLIPDVWLEWEGVGESPDELRKIYIEFINLRLGHTDLFIQEAENARSKSL